MLARIARSSQYCYRGRPLGGHFGKGAMNPAFMSVRYAVVEFQNVLGPGPSNAAIANKDDVIASQISVIAGKEAAITEKDDTIAFLKHDKAISLSKIEGAIAIKDDIIASYKTGKDEIDTDKDKLIKKLEGTVADLTHQIFIQRAAERFKRGQALVQAEHVTAVQVLDAVHICCGLRGDDEKGWTALFAQQEQDRDPLQTRFVAIVRRSLGPNVTAAKYAAFMPQLYRDACSAPQEKAGKNVPVGHLADDTVEKFFKAVSMPVKQQ